MIEFFIRPDLWTNIIGGIVAAGLVALFAFLWNRRKHKIMRDLIEIMGRAIQHRNTGEKKEFINEKEWVQKAKAIKEEAVVKAKKLSPSAGSLIEWLDRVPPWSSTSEVEKYVSFLSVVIQRIRALMERHS